MSIEEKKCTRVVDHHWHWTVKQTSPAEQRERERERKVFARWLHHWSPLSFASRWPRIEQLGQIWIWYRTKSRGWKENRPHSFSIDQKKKEHHLEPIFFHFFQSDIQLVRQWNLFYLRSIDSFIRPIHLAAPFNVDLDPPYHFEPIRHEVLPHRSITMHRQTPNRHRSTSFSFPYNRFAKMNRSRKWMTNHRK